MISQTGAAIGHCDIALAVEEGESERILDFLRKHHDEIGAKGLLLERNLAMLAVFGHRLAASAGTAGQIFKILSDMGINIEVISAGPVSMTLMLPRSQGQRACDAIRDAFGLK